MYCCFQATWYLEEEDGNKIQVSGRLRHKFYNLRRKFIKVGLISSAKLREELESDEGIGINISELKEQCSEMNHSSNYL